MREAQLLIPLILLTAPSPVSADVTALITASSAVIPATAGCGQTVTGTLSASASFSCTFPGDGRSYSGFAETQLGTGPYGIGVSADLSAKDGGIEGLTWSAVTFAWSEVAEATGATGNGFVSVAVEGPCGGPSVFFVPGGINISLWGQTGLPGGPTGCGFAVDPIPIVFGEPYTLSLSGSLECEGADFEGCTNYSTYVSSMDFTDSAGNSLPGISIVPVPEPASIAMLITALGMLTLGCRRLHGSHTPL